MSPKVVEFVRGLAQTFINATIYRVVWAMDIKVVIAIAIVLGLGVSLTL